MKAGLCSQNTTSPGFLIVLSFSCAAVGYSIRWFERVLSANISRHFSMAVSKLQSHDEYQRKPESLKKRSESKTLETKPCVTYYKQERERFKTH
jgi:cell shape-determining protein MreC